MVTYKIDLLNKLFIYLFIYWLIGLGCQEYEDLKLQREKKKDTKKRMVGH